MGTTGILADIPAASEIYRFLRINTTTGMLENQI
jgi:hypothetical protein